MADMSHLQHYDGHVTSYWSHLNPSKAELFFYFSILFLQEMLKEHTP